MPSVNETKISTLLNNLNILSDDLTRLDCLKLKIIDMGVSGVFNAPKNINGTGSDVVQTSYDISGKGTRVHDKHFQPYLDVPKHWDWATTEELCFTQTGTTPEKGSVPAGTAPITYITSADLNEFMAQSTTKVVRFPKSKAIRVAPAGSVLFVGIGNIGKCGVTTEEVTFNQQIHSATPYVMNPKYICYFYSSSFFRKKVSAISSATTLTILNKSKWSGIHIPVPTLDEQDRIVQQIEKLLAICSQIVEGINRRALMGLAVRKSMVNAISSAQTQEEFEIAWNRLLHHWNLIAGTAESVESLRNLILTLAINGNLTKDLSPEDTTEELLDRVSKTLNPHPEISDERFAIPSNWKWVSLASVAEHQLGKMLHTAKMKGVRRPYLRSVNVRQNGSIDLTDLNEMLIPESELEKYSVKKGDLFVNEGGDVGRNAIFDLEIDFDLAFQNQLHRLRPVCGIESRYIQLVLRQAKSQGVISQMSSGVTIQHFSASALRRFAIPLPPLSEQKLIVKKVNLLMKFCDDLEHEISEASRIAEKFARSVVSESA